MAAPDNDMMQRMARDFCISDEEFDEYMSFKKQWDMAVGVITNRSEQSPIGILPSDWEAAINDSIAAGPG